MTALPPDDPNKASSSFRKLLWSPSQLPTWRGLLAFAVFLFGLLAIQALWYDHPRVALVVGANLFGGVMLYLRHRGRAA
jgi:hypothetical protein